MKKILFFALILSGASFAQTPPFPSPMSKPPLPPNWQNEGMLLLMERFDTDKDGKLNDEERRAVASMAKKLLEEKKRAILEKYDKNRNGHLEADELVAMRCDWERRDPGIGQRVRHRMRESRRDDRLELCQRFDKDGDGRLNEEERSAMRQWLRTHSPQQKERAHRPSSPPHANENERKHEQLPPIPRSVRFNSKEAPHPRADKESIPGQRIVIEALMTEKLHREHHGEDFPAPRPCVPPNYPPQGE